GRQFGRYRCQAFRHRFDYDRRDPSQADAKGRCGLPVRRNAGLLCGEAVRNDHERRRVAGEVSAEAARSQETRGTLRSAGGRSQENRELGKSEIRKTKAVPFGTAFSFVGCRVTSGKWALS